MAATLETFAVDSHTREYDAGQVIFQAYDMGSEMYIVREGTVEITVGDTVVETVGPGDLFGEMALIDQAPRVATATAKTRCKLDAIGERQFLFMVQTTPHFALRIMKVMADRLRKMNQRV